MAATGDPESRSRIDSLLHSRLHDPRLGHNVAFLVIDAATGAVISKQAPGRQMRAASNMKLVTATTALATMGPHRRFQIRVLAGSQTNDIVLQGGGDPLLSRGDLDRLAARTARHLHKGARVVVHVDDGLFPKPTRAHGWVDEYLGNSVGMVQALAIQGDRSMHPSRNAAEAFAVRLRALGIKATVGPNKDAAPDAVVLASFRGHSVAAAIAMMLRNSDSSIAEVLFRQVAITAGRPANWEGSRRAAMEALRGLGLNPAALVLVDGSGLSRDDRLTPSFLTRLLALVRVKERQRFAAIFAPNALPTAGRTGTLARSYGRYSTSPSNCAVGDVRAKTGTIRGTIALSGVAHTRSGQLRIFSIIVNDRPGGYSALSTRRAVDGLVATITGCWH
jgi:D-alanyl-D-alanine carboxypeptidase/D-alanyl-D-alanine-endopeptidase (penicillin-binding protein 4)